jgi:hypothetical protein
MHGQKGDENLIARNTKQLRRSQEAGSSSQSLELAKALMAFALKRRQISREEMLADSRADLQLRYNQEATLVG